MLSSPHLLQPRTFWRWGAVLLGGGFGVGLLLVVYLTWLAPELVPYFLFLLVAGVSGWILFHHPLLNLCAVLAGFFFVTAAEEGIQLAEVAYGLYATGFLAHWFVTRLFFYRDRLFERPEERALLLFQFGLPFTVVLTVLFGGKLGGVVSEWWALLMLAFYFPVKEACVRYRHGIRAVLVVMMLVALAVVLRNLLDYQRILLQATQAWQVTKGRVATNDNVLMIASLTSVVFLLFVRRWWMQLALSGLFAAYFAGLILTQSRGFWVAFAFGVFVLFLLVDGRDRKHLLVLGLIGGAALATVSLILLGDQVFLVLGGLMDRFASLGSATTQDLSLVNRFRETAVVWERVSTNPILGHGMGVPYRFYDMTWDATRIDTFLHNGFVSLWYKFGLWGLLSILTAWLLLIWRGIGAFRMRSASMPTRLAGLAAALCLLAYLLPANTSNPFFLKDGTFLFGVLMGLAGGAYERARSVEARPS